MSQDNQTPATAEKKTRSVQMTDGSVCEFTEKQKLQKMHGKTEAGLVFCQINFDNGEIVRVEVDPASEIAIQALGHGLSQKLGDAAAGAESTGDAVESIAELAKRIMNGEWSQQRASGGTAKGASELVLAMCAVLGLEREAVRNALATLSAAEKAALRTQPKIAAEIERIKAEKAPSKKEQERAARGDDLLSKLQAGLAGA